MMNLHNLIMNIPCVSASSGSTKKANYNEGHRDARHAAAELALTADAEIVKLRKALQFAQSGFALAYGAASKNLTDEVLLHCGHHKARIANALDA